GYKNVWLIRPNLISLFMGVKIAKVNLYHDVCLCESSVCRALNRSLIMSSFSRWGSISTADTREGLIASYILHLCRRPGCRWHRRPGMALLKDGIASSSRFQPARH